MIEQYNAFLSSADEYGRKKWLISDYAESVNL